MKHIALFVLGAAALIACSLVDEDMRDCENDYTLDYELQLVTNLTTELQTQLSLAADVSLSSALETKMKDIFTDYAHDVDLSFYDVSGDSLRLHHESHIMDATESSYTLYIPVRKYMHLAAANVGDNKMVQLLQGEKCHEASFHQLVQDTLNCHKTGLYSARLLMDIQEGVDQKFDVHLFMVNCATSVILDTLGSGIKDAKVFLTGFATDFDLADSTYRYEFSPIIRPDKVDVSGEANPPICYASVNFPSRDITPQTKVVIDTDEPFVSENADKALWEIRVYCTLKDGSMTETRLGMLRPLRAGQFKVVDLKVKDSGAALPNTPSGDEDPTMAISITLDWHSGMVIEVPL